ncbi:recombinase family protein [Gracilibacillus caseinilyticus]|uniref:Recombinase family protein n=1 Tax=Gracilibacillus caseinilyticus TaxID=2932256 RepID=A0ABY4EXY0_9BACI|nr:recombinase family protein [Gracilibacillus caseinilyticus]UOQ49268.1 recombinase family protein [Gracilibacillus caseinilyticus]
MIIGYMRPYHNDNNCEFQSIYLSGINCKRIFTEEHSSAKKREKLQEMMNSIEEDDIVVVTKLYILADSTRHLMELLETLEMKGAYLQSIQEGIDTGNDKGIYFTEMLKHLLHFQSDLISERTKKGLHEAKEKGVNSGRPRKADENVKKAIRMYQSKNYTLAEIKTKTGISKSTLYRYLER